MKGLLFSGASASLDYPVEAQLMNRCAIHTGWVEELTEDRLYFSLLSVSLNAASHIQKKSTWARFFDRGVLQSLVSKIWIKYELPEVIQPLGEKTYLWREEFIATLVRVCNTVNNWGGNASSDLCFSMSEMS